MPPIDPLALSWQAVKVTGIIRKLQKMGIMGTELSVVLVTVPTLEKGKEIAHALLGQELVSCVNILPAMTSLYFWEGKLCEESEVLLIIKTTMQPLSTVEDAIKKIHPYSVPEFVALQPTYVSSDYLTWASTCFRTK